MSALSRQHDVASFLFRTRMKASFLIVPKPVEFGCKPMFQVAITGMHTNALDAYDSLLKIKRVADIVVPNHDPDFQHGSRITL